MRRRDMLLGMPALLLASGSPAFAAAAQRVLVRVDTELGALLIAVFPRKAPVTTANFLAYVDAHYLDDGSVYRIVTPDNQHPEPAVKVSLVQWGMNLGQQPPPLPPIAHETTAMTGLRHRHGTVSMARLEPGTAASEFFICVGDQPELDFGGHRNPDGAGFAAFGEVVVGGQVLDALYARAESDHMLRRPIPLRGVARA
jgi:peptidyl-prolyl cis-trans isomerase A (cyclophilin A)